MKLPEEGMLLRIFIGENDTLEKARVIKYRHS